MPKGKKVYAVIDTNVLVSTLYSKNENSSTAIVVNSVVKGIITPVFNDEIIQEYTEVLNRPAFKFPPSLVNLLIENFREKGINAEKVNIENEDFPDPKDIVFYEVKMAVNDSYLVTGNIKHFPKKSFVVTPAQMVEILKQLNLIEN